MTSFEIYSGKKVCIAGGAGFIGSHLAKRLKEAGNTVIVADIKPNEFMKESEYCNEFHLVDLREKSNCISCTKDCHHVYNLAADLGGMGFIESNQSSLMYNNTLISTVVNPEFVKYSSKRLFP